MTIFDTIIAPPSAPQRRPDHESNCRAAEILAALRERSGQPIGTWRLLDRLARTRQPRERGHLRFWRLMYWGHLRDLLRTGLVFRHGRQAVGLNPPAGRNGPRQPSRYSPLHNHNMGGSCVGSENTKKAGSTAQGTDRLQSTDSTKRVENQLVQWNRALEQERKRTESAEQSQRQREFRPSSEAIQQAARELAQQPRGPKRWSGWLHGRRTWQRMPVVVPDGRVLPLFSVRRGQVYVLIPDETKLARLFERFHAHEVSIHKSPAACVLGSMKKGRTEVPSLIKQRAARANGLKGGRPCQQSSDG
jgi:hypothetical protein